jgi:hypothetical protein
MGADSRYDRARPVGAAEYQQSRALHIVAELVRDYPGITKAAVAGQIAHILHAAANELGNGRALPVDPVEVGTVLGTLPRATRIVCRPPPEPSPASGAVAASLPGSRCALLSARVVVACRPRGDPPAGGLRPSGSVRPIV